MSAMTVLDSLLAALKHAAEYNRHDQTKPTVVLWTDPDRLWERVLPTLRKASPELLTLSSEATDTEGVSTYLRYVLGKWDPEKGVPLIYLPGISRQHFRGPAGFPEAAKHLYALQFQGQFWEHTNGKDWTPVSFLGSTPNHGGLGLDVAKDQSTKEAVSGQLEVLLQTEVNALAGKKLDAAAINRLAVDDPIRQILRWMGASGRTQDCGWSDAETQAFYAICKRDFGFDPAKDGLVYAQDRFVEPDGPWDPVWNRFAEAPSAYPEVARVMETAQPADLMDRSNLRFPRVNEQREAELRRALAGLEMLAPSPARETLARLVGEHRERAAGPWAALGRARLAEATILLGEMLDAMGRQRPGTDAASFAADYQSEGWKVDAAARRAFALARDKADAEAIRAALRAVYLPWLEAAAAHLQSAPPEPDSSSTRTTGEAGTVWLFIDGLRADLALELQGRLEKTGWACTAHPRWSALPTVTATAKPAWHPLAAHLEGRELTETFQPQLRGKDKDCDTAEFRKLLKECGWSWIDASETGVPAQTGWTEAGAFDRYGHDQGAKLAWRVEEELNAIEARIRELLSAGWSKVRVVTDHGWLWLPGGLPKVDFPKHLTLSKWGRCAVAQPGAQHGFPKVGWYWNSAHAVVLAPGVHCFQQGTEYTHGGLTLQEAFLVELEITGGASAQGETQPVTIESAQWSGLRLRVRVTPAEPGLRLDLRTRAGDPASSVLPSGASKTTDADGAGSLVVENEAMEGNAAVLVVLRGDQIVAKKNLTVGEN
jgi:hypothetical protein